LVDSSCKKLAAPCGLYCGVCVDYLDYKSCHDCQCSSESCDSTEHHANCDVYKCCVDKKGIESCGDCDDFPCSKLIQFRCSPIWIHHLPVIENLRRRKIIGAEKWDEEQREVWSNEWYLERCLWLQKECENRLKRFRGDT
jgi:hypothetical protein